MDLRSAIRRYYVSCSTVNNYVLLTLLRSTPYNNTPIIEYTPLYRVRVHWKIFLNKAINRPWCVVLHASLTGQVTHAGAWIVCLICYLRLTAVSNPLILTVPDAILNSLRGPSTNRGWLVYRQDSYTGVQLFHLLSTVRQTTVNLRKSPSVPQRVNSVLHKKRRRSQKEQLPRLALFGPWLPIRAKEAVSLPLTPIIASHLAIIF